MAVREIVLSTDDFLRKKSLKVTSFDDRLHELLDDMRETLMNADGVGLAAVQVGMLKRAFIINVNDSYMEFVNPVITNTKGKQVKKEGCLSVKQEYMFVERPKQLTIEAYDRMGNFFSYTCSEWNAVAIAHEYDHMEGVLYTDRAQKVKK